MEIYVVIMAGGSGTRFWPRSRRNMPKQLLNIFGQNTMIQNTCDRLKGFVDPDRILIITNKIQKAIIEEQLPEIDKENVIAEPIGRNTAPCVGLSAILVRNKSKDSVVVTLPADHLINPKKSFQSDLRKAVKFADESRSLITFGINPTRPDTGYGYIQLDRSSGKNKIFKAKKFVEKPDLRTAHKYLGSGEYLWNSGMFVWKNDAILDQFMNHQPGMFEKLLQIEQGLKKDRFNKVLDKIYPKFESISIDYAIMEKASNVFVVESKFNWNDAGSWETVYELSKKDKSGNASFGDVLKLNTRNSYLYSPDKFMAVLGMEDLIVIDTKDAILIGNRWNVQEIREIVDYLRKKKRDALY